MGYNPSYKWINPTYPIYNWGYNPLTKWDEPPSTLCFSHGITMLPGSMTIFYLVYIIPTLHCVKWAASPLCCFQDSPTTEDALGVLPGQQRGCTKIHRKNDGMTNNDGLTNKHLMVKPANDDGLKEDLRIN